MTNLYSYYLQVLFLCFIVINHLLEIYLSRRQLTILQQNKDIVPAEFQDSLSLVDHQKAIAYASARLNLNQMRLLFDAVLLFYWFPFRGVEKLFLAIPDLGTHREVIFLLLFALFRCSLPCPSLSIPHSL